MGGLTKTKKDSPDLPGWVKFMYGPGTWLTLQLVPRLSCVRTVSICSQQSPWECWISRIWRDFRGKVEAVSSFDLVHLSGISTGFGAKPET